MNAPTVEDYAGPLPEGWTGGQALVKWWRGRYVHLYTVRRPCAQCGASMRIDVSRQALEGKVKNAGLHMRRCATCRASTKALNTHSRPYVEGEEAAPPTSQAQEIMIATMKEELAGLYAQNKELRERLAKYELQPALEAVANGAKMPWES